MKEDNKNQSMQNNIKSNTDASRDWTHISKDDLMRDAVSGVTGRPRTSEPKKQTSLDDILKLDLSFLDKAERDVLERARCGTVEPVTTEEKNSTLQNQKEEIAEEIYPEQPTPNNPEPYLPPTETVAPDKIRNSDCTDRVEAEEISGIVESTGSGAEETENVSEKKEVHGIETSEAADITGECGTEEIAAKAGTDGKEEKLTAAERKARREAEELEEYIQDENAFIRKSHKRNVKNFVMNAIMMVSVSVFLICALELGIYTYQSIRYKASMDELRNNIDGGISQDISDRLNQMTQDNGDAVVFPDEEYYDILQATQKEEIGDVWAEKYAYLVENNPDCFGYIEIPDTNVSYPVMFTPEDYDYYLWKNFSGEHETRGTPFMDAATKLGKSQNYLIYGHNMTDNSAFGDIKGYLSKSFYADHKYIYFNTSVSEGVYEVMAVVKTKVFTVEDQCFKYYKYGGVLTEEEFKTYVREVTKQSVYKTGVTAEWGDQLITLSTCNHYTENGRLIIVAKRIL